VAIVTRRVDISDAPHIRSRLDGRDIVGLPVQFYRRQVRGAGVCGLWIGGEPVYDVTLYDVAGRPVGTIDSEDSYAPQMYDELRRVLVAEDIHA